MSEEQERLEEELEELDQRAGRYAVKIKRLEAEVERLRNALDTANKAIEWYSKRALEDEHLRAKVERLNKQRDETLASVCVDITTLIATCETLRGKWRRALGKK